MKILSFLLFGSIAIAMPWGKGSIPPLPDETLIVPIADVHQMDPGGNEGVFQALGLHRRTAVRHLIERTGSGDREVIRMVAMELVEVLQGVRHHRLEIPGELTDVARVAVRSGTQDLLSDPQFQNLLIWYLREYYLYEHAIPRYVASGEGDVFPGGVLIALAHVHRIDLVVYRTDNNSVARPSFEYLLGPREGEERPPRVLLLRGSDDRYHRLHLSSSPQMGQLIRLNYLQHRPLFLLHELHLTRAPVMTLVFDLDETLVNNRGNGPAQLRPYVLDTLQDLRRMPGLEIILWTASLRDVALPVVRQLEQNSLIFDAIIYRDDRWFSHVERHWYVKDLEQLGRDMRRVVMVENSAVSIRLQQGNAILVEDFIAQREDYTLSNLLAVVMDLMTHVREGGSVVEALSNLQGRMQTFLHRLEVPVYGTFMRVLSSRANQTSAAASSGPTHQASAE